MTLNHHLKMRQQMKQLIDHYYDAINKSADAEQRHISQLLLRSVRADLKAVEATINEA